MDDRLSRGPAALVSAAMGFRIGAVHAFVAVGDDDEEGVIGMKIPGTNTFMPLVMADEVRLRQMRPYAALVARQSGRPVQLIRLSQREDLETIQP